MKKSLILSTVFILICSLAVSCAVQPAPGPNDLAPAGTVSGEADAPDVQIGYSGSLAADASFARSIDASSVIIKGVCVEKTVNEMRAASDARVSVTEVYRGRVSVGDELLVRVNGTEDVKNGGEYLFLTIPMASVYEGIELFYQADSVFPLSEGDSYLGELPDIKGISNAELISRLEEYVSKNEYNGAEGVCYAYSASENLDEIKEFSDCIVLVRAESVTLDYIPDRTSYECTVISCVKGEAAGTIKVVAFKDSMEPGSEYMLMVMGPYDGVYLMSSQKSIQPYVTAAP